MTVSLSHDEPIHIGLDNKGQEVDWSYTLVNNFNILFMGMSGAGKTHTIHQMLARIHARGTTFHVIDIKGDFGYENLVDSGLGAYVTPDDFNNIRFDYYDGASINPLQVPSTKQGGGVLMTIETMKTLVKSFSPNIGVKQLGYLGDVLKMVYEERGIVHDDESTWVRPSPTLHDLLGKIDLVFNVISSGLSIGSVTEIMQAFGKSKSKAESTITKMNAEEKDQIEITEKINEQADSLIELVTGMVKQSISYNTLQKGSVGNGAVYEYWSKDSLYGLRSVIQGMVDSRLFTGNPSRTQRGKINRYDLTEISPQHQQVIMRIVASRVFAMGVMETRLNNTFNPTTPNHILVADEGKHVKEISQSAMSPFNRIGTEGRGYGVGIWCGVQQPDQVTADLLKNFATFFILKTPESTYPEVSRMFGVKPAYMKQLTARENILFSASGGYSLVSHFKE